MTNALPTRYSELLNSLDSGAVTKITVNNRRMNKANFEQSILMPMQGDFRDEYRREYNQMLLDKGLYYTHEQLHSQAFRKNVSVGCDRR